MMLILICLVSIILFAYILCDTKQNIYISSYIWKKKYLIKPHCKCNISIKIFPKYNFSMYIRSNNDHISNILRNGNMYSDCINLYNIWFNTSPNKKDIFVDVGANIGTCSLFLMHYYIKTIAFEPVIDNLYIFTTSLLYNQYMLNLITLYKIGLGSKKEKKRIHCYNRNMGSSSMINTKNSTYTLDVYIYRLDSVINLHRKIHLLKVDVEGYEFEVIKGSKILLENKLIDYIYMEINCSILKVDPRKIYLYLELYSYTANKKYYCNRNKKSGNVLFYRKDILNKNFLILNNSY